MARCQADSRARHSEEPGGINKNDNPDIDLPLILSLISAVSFPILTHRCTKMIPIVCVHLQDTCVVRLMTLIWSVIERRDNS